MDAGFHIYQEYAAAWLLPLEKRVLLRVLKLFCDVANGTGLGEPIAGIELTLTSDARIAGINRDCMGCTGPTNILSFPGGSDLPGSLVLSLDTLAREAFLYGQRQERHLLHLIAHGTAHLAGLSHGTSHETIHKACLAAGDFFLKSI
ncbi:MAG: rRNA maturation RNase YbeY [Desulfovibrionaceae bacterium]|nr:rRNA maturation RNase YbeY [Desulfovibrionaceae bacterium]